MREPLTLNMEVLNDLKNVINLDAYSEIMKIIMADVKMRILGGETSPISVRFEFNEKQKEQIIAEGLSEEEQLYA